MAEIRKTINKDLSVVRGSTSTFFTGVDDVMNMPFDPFVSGFAYFRIIDVPSWFEKDPDLMFFKDFINKNTRGFSGLTDIELEMAQHQTGFAGNEYGVVTGVKRGNTEFTTTHKEFSSGIMRKLFQKYISYVRDPRTGSAMYPEVFNVEYGARNHTCTVLYMTVRPDATNKSSPNVIEHAAFYSNVLPTTIPLADLYGTFETGTQDSPVISIQWSAFPEFGPDVESYALKVLREDILNVGPDKDGIPFIDSMGNNKDAVALLNSGFMQKIYNPKE